jgi:hypothetical protein
MPTTKAKLAALKELRELPVDAGQLWRSTPVGGVPPVDECAVLKLARAIHRAESTRCSTSWSAQDRAAAYFNKHGLAETLSEAFRLAELALPDSD